jgi:lysozyme family protein
MEATKPPRPGAAPQTRAPSAKKGGIPAVVLAMIAATMTIEGGYVNHPADPGGETNMGVTKQVAVANGYTGPMRQLPREVAQGIYYRRYIVAPGYEPLLSIDAAVTEELYDTAVNMGPARPSTWFQQSIDATCGAQLVVDGQIGAATINAYRACQTKIGASELCRRMLEQLDAQQRGEYGRLVARNARLKVFYKGWVAKRIGNVDRRKCAVAA